MSSAINAEKDVSSGTITHTVILAYTWFHALNFIITKLIINIVFRFKYFSNFDILY